MWQDKFYAEIRDLHHQNQVDEYYRRKTPEYQSETQYSIFKAWCFAFHREKTENNFIEFLEYRKEKLGFAIMKKIYENYFGYKFWIDEETRRWSCEKILN